MRIWDLGFGIYEGETKLLHECQSCEWLQTPSEAASPDGGCGKLLTIFHFLFSFFYLLSSIFYFHFMKRSNDQPLKDALNELLDTYHLKERVNELRLKENWEKIFGKTIAKYTQAI